MSADSAAGVVASEEALSLWTLEEITRIVSLSGDPSETLSNVVNLLQRRFSTEVCSVYLLESDRTRLVLSATIGLRQDCVGRIAMQLHEGLVGLVAQTLQTQVVADATAHPRFRYFPEAGEDPYHAFLGAPVLDRGLLQGVVVLQTREARHFSPPDVRMLTAAATQLAPILSDARFERRLALERELVQRAKAELVETLAGGVAHELNNKLLPAAGYAELMIEDAQRLGSQELEERCRTVRDCVFEASRIIRQLLQLSKPSASEHAVCDFREVVRQALTLMRLRIQEEGSQIIVDLPDAEVLVNADAGQLKQVLLNLVWNALDAMEHASARSVVIRLEQEAGRAVVSCTDSGSGIPRELVARIFDPFFTTKAPSRGTGLGLSMCQAIVKQHGGEMHVSSAVGTGTTIRVSLPLHVGPRPEQTPPVALPVPDVVHGAQVLVVEDEEQVLELAKRILETKLRCRVEGARNGAEARAALEQRDFDLVLSDVRMPEMNGVELLGWITRHRPQMLRRTVFMTGDGSGAGLNPPIEEAGCPLLRKPFSVAALVSTIQRVLEIP